MPSIDIVAETHSSSIDGLKWWTDIIDSHPLIRLWGGMTDAECSALVIALARQNQLEIGSNFSETSGHIAVEDSLILSGGLRVWDEARTITMGCCCGVEDWREQVATFLKGGGWLGHDPAPWLQYKGESVRVWSDGELSSVASQIFSIDVPRTTVAELPNGIQKDLQAFLHALTRWGEWRIGKNLTNRLVAKLDEALQISAESWIDSFQLG